MEGVKKCSKCGRELPMDQFYKKKLKSGRVGRQGYCKDCAKASADMWRKNNLEKRRIKNAIWRKNNPDKCRANAERWRKNNPEKYRAGCLNWMKNNPGHSANYDRMRRAIDPNFSMKKRIRNAINKALNGGIKSAHAGELLGCSIEELRDHLERQFQPGMTWDNYGVHGWHIDHIIPLSYFDHSDPKQQKRAWHYTNLQPLWAKDNLRKRDKIEECQLTLL